MDNVITTISVALNKLVYTCMDNTVVITFGALFHVFDEEISDSLISLEITEINYNSKAKFLSLQ